MQSAHNITLYIAHIVFRKYGEFYKIQCTLENSVKKLRNQEEETSIESMAQFRLQIPSDVRP